MKKATLCLLATAVLSASSLAFAQSIAAPAGSVDSGARAQVAITPVDTSNLATKTEVNNAINWTETRYNQAINYTNSQMYQPGYGSIVKITSATYIMDGGAYQVQGVCVVGFPNHAAAIGGCPAGSGFQPTEAWYRYTPA